MPDTITTDSPPEVLFCNNCGTAITNSNTVCPILGCGHCLHCCGGNECARSHHTHRSICEHCNRCTYHCQCRQCNLCDETHDADTMCPVCGRCQEECCNCVECNDCGNDTRPQNICGDCGYCFNCCDCEEDDDSDRPVELVCRGLHWFAAGKLEYKKNPVKRFISCEIEVANAASGTHIEDAARKWSCSIQEDGSLPSTGFEVSTAPAQGDIFLQQIKELCDAFAICDADITASCGLHVHIDARDLRYWDIRRLLLLYAKLEQGLFDLCPPSRSRSEFCRKCGDEFAELVRTGKPRQVRDKLLAKMYGSKPQVRYVKQDKHGTPYRYNALNIHSWLHRGSIEFRMGGGTVDYTKITNWSMLLAGIIDYVAKYTDKDVEELKGQPLTLLKKLAPTKEVRLWITDRYNHLLSQRPTRS